ncbi:hypothetical protein PUV47_03840 [Pseudovibrio exalbescens]|uniref:capsular polysaccharide export protein, LipB/KpsS family n=1 Tax=Pseudovibrio exalbescens TaxID=197461 RepID=UPI002366602F|nr:hypothetical protein [Pseudovibrio exalbescens]MDD7909035.1 hypothetical protein [Pseudovibrio exalbescens]
MTPIYCFDSESRRFGKDLIRALNLQGGVLGAPLAFAKICFEMRECDVLVNARCWAEKYGNTVYIWSKPAQEVSHQVAGTTVRSVELYGAASELAAVSETNYERGPVPLRLVEKMQKVWLCNNGMHVGEREALELKEAEIRHAAETLQPAICVGVKFWNHRGIRKLIGRGRNVRFVKDPETGFKEAAKTRSRLIGWGNSVPNSIIEACRKEEITFQRIEDGFLRSVGLGAGLISGASVAFDDHGIYYDPRSDSRLFRLLNQLDLSARQLERGKELKRILVAARVSKYNLTGAPSELSAGLEQEVVLVPGQVADDMAVRRGLSDLLDCENSPNINIDLLKKVREDFPEAYVVYKPHPDVAADLRKGKVSEAVSAGLCDQVVSNADIIDLIERADRVVTFSSLAGFEALVRDKPVTAYGLPFYAGWGLTDDRTKSLLRVRQRSLEELLYITLVEYMRAIDPITLNVTTPEILIRRLMEMRERTAARPKRLALQYISWAARKLRL